MIKCKICGERIVCPEHGDKYIDYVEDDERGEHYYWCNKCLEKYQSVFGSLLHYCELEAFLSLCASGKADEIVKNLLEEKLEK